MCGRFALFSSPIDLSKRLQISSPPEWKWKSHYNIPPGTEIVGIRYSESEDQPVFDQLWWGYHPHWADEKSPVPINAKAENLDSSPYFRGSFRHHRCLIPADGWFEWKQLDKGKQPYFFAREDREPLFMAGVWVNNPDDRPCCAIITEPARGKARDVHPRMPLVLDDSCLEAWLDPKLQEKEILRETIERLDPDAFTCWQVSTKVNRTDNDKAELIEPLRS
ncbi:SOS response-associated peptidase [Kineobactrum sediminis]|uniref:Abasic site processing protein n=1 Tax=Kineobactrum sediminis TaxID=1905677 RepID=A0A2N5Y4B3_9GAMM|nr:SOS response-associated peptidase [Kineobactrum sediminis]PLW83236.1 SOS response-associated peptidase [Kineobactrum sediminis]